MPRRLLSVALLIWLAGITAAFAQTPSPLPEWQYSSGIVLERMYMGALEGWRVLAGPAAEYQPAYDGARKYRADPGIALDIRYDEFGFISTGEGIGVNVINGTNYRAGVAIAYDLGREEKTDRANLDGMGNIPADPVAKLFAVYAISKSFPLIVRADGRYTLFNSRGFSGDVGAYLPMPGSSEKLVWFCGPSVTFADQRYMQTFFGVTPRQAANSGHPAFEASGGLKSVGGGISLEWFFHEDWLLNLQLGYAHLMGDAAESPLTRNENGYSTGFAIIYQF